RDAEGRFDERIGSRALAPGGVHGELRCREADRVSLDLLDLRSGAIEQGRSDQPTPAATNARMVSAESRPGCAPAVLRARAVAAPGSGASAWYATKVSPASAERGGRRARARRSPDGAEPARVARGGVVVTGRRLVDESGNRIIPF